jgi:ABC-type antimicrobial peptide transport system permease subunit
MRSLRDQQLVPLRFGAAFMSMLGGLGFAVAVVGVAGMMAQTAKERSRECAVRMALGACPRTVAVQLCRRIAPSVTVGALAGCAIGIALHVVGRAMSGGSAQTNILAGLATGVLTLTVSLSLAVAVAWLRCRTNLAALLREN